MTDLLLADTRQTQANNVLNVHRNDNLLIGGKGVWRWGKREITYLSLHCHHNDSFIKMCRDENHFTVSLIVRDMVTRQYPQLYNPFEEPERIAEAESSRVPSAYQPNKTGKNKILTLLRERERERERERVSLCRVSLFLCSVC